ncbi:lipopolysaccharide transport periplasmic protein LptA [Methylomarinum sp. Ch1-1]|uniref:Lipopolysaccharide export system protein LptA n=1 Tax=Methylomarinum roseum TaxID=3067653 RepID=A0AAU7NZA5_9GAMM|nr:lipopolysaccharide transport periplasmic protein LptA [Methylomarinum sp. Ch1-1]MDP4521961.1 lipopolysaccharide transport periplasmic protein LptA [Methylomarinum sp. Ch1-1]
MKSINLVACWLALFSTGAMALESDSEQPIYIDSNTATYDDKAQTSVYTGNVVTIQGSLRVDSDKLVVYLKQGEISKMVATGEKAKFEQLPGEGQEKIKGEALIGEYYPNKNLLILKKEAVVWQAGNKSASDLIRYDSKNALIKAGEKSSDSKRVHSVFMPKEKKTQ